MTATLDLLEHRGWIRRAANPDDRRSVLIEITPDGRAIADQLLPGIRITRCVVQPCWARSGSSSS